jgi:hypothetical protein
MTRGNWVTLVVAALLLGTMIGLWFGAASCA